jgi:hypothetical protein
MTVQQALDEYTNLGSKTGEQRLKCVKEEQILIWCLGLDGLKPITHHHGQKQVSVSTIRVVEAFV